RVSSVTGVQTCALPISIPSEPGIVVAPADGRVTIVRLADGHEYPESLISIFLSPLDVHINRAPIAGEIVEIAYKTGKFVMATKEIGRASCRERGSDTAQ